LCRKVIDHSCLDEDYTYYKYRVDSDGIRIEARCNGITIEKKIDAVIEGGEDTVFFTDYQLITEAAKIIPEAEIHAKIENQRLLVSYKNGSFFVPVLKKENVDRWLEINPDSGIDIKVPAKAIVVGAKSVIPFVSTDNTFATLRNIVCDIKDNMLVWVASNGHLLSKVTTKADRLKGNARWQMSALAASVLVDAFSKASADDIVEINVRDNAVRVTGANVIIDMVNPNTHFPNYDKVMPQTGEQLKIDTYDAVNALSRVSSVSGGASVIQVSLTHDKAEIKSTSMFDNLSTNEALHCEYSGDDIVFGVICENLRKALKAMRSQQAVIMITDPSHPMLAYPAEENDKDTSVQIVMMPSQL